MQGIVSTELYKRLSSVFAIPLENCLWYHLLVLFSNKIVFFLFYLGVEVF